MSTTKRKKAPNQIDQNPNDDRFVVSAVSANKARDDAKDAEETALDSTATTGIASVLNQLSYEIPSQQ